MKTTNILTNQQCIEELNTLKAYFIQQSGGAYPECIDYAITVLEKSIQKTQKALSMREDNRRRPHE